METGGSKLFENLRLRVEYRSINRQVFVLDSLLSFGLDGEWIGVGAGWPQGQLESKITEHLKSGRRVFLDTDPRWWLPCSWHVSEIEELAKIDPHFHFKEVASGIYEIRLFEDQSAKDQPHLENLLPEKRPEEVKRCFDSG